MASHAAQTYSRPCAFNRLAFSRHTIFGDRNHRYSPPHFADVYFIRSSSGNVTTRAKVCSSSY